VDTHQDGWKRRFLRKSRPLLAEAAATKHQIRRRGRDCFFGSATGALAPRHHRNTGVALAIWAFSETGG